MKMKDHLSPTKVLAKRDDFPMFPLESYDSLAPSIESTLYHSKRIQNKYRLSIWSVITI